MPRSLRARLTLAFAALTTVSVGAFAAGLALLVERAVWGPLDAGLVEEATTLATLVDLSPDRLAEAVRDLGSEDDLGPGKFLQVVGADGRILARYQEVPRAVAARHAPRSGGLQLATVGRGDVIHRVVWAPVPGGGHIEMGVRAASQVQLVGRARVAIGSVAAGLVALLSVLAWAITSRATLDLERLAAELETIEAGSLDRRLAPRRTTEVDRLAIVLNRVLERLAAAVAHLRRFTADAAHELRTPIAALRAHLEVAIARATTVEEAHAGLLDALEQTERLGRLSEDLLMLSAVESDTGNFIDQARPVRVDLLVRELVDFLAPVAEEQHRAFTCEATTEVAVRGVPNLLKRVVLNLVDNAFRHTPPGVPVRLSVRRVAQDVEVEVADRGPGMSSDEVARVFERFRRGSTPTSGSGLGLALVREIVHRHGGRVAVESAPDAGTVVVVALPQAAVTPAS